MVSAPREGLAVSVVTSRCDLCGSGSQELIFRGPDRLHGIPGEFDLVRCQGCGLIFVSPRPSLEAMAPYYPQEEYDLYNKAAGLKDQSMEELERLLGPRRAVIEKYQQPGRLLDIGFGDGSFLYYMKQRGWQVTGVDFNEKMVEQARANGIEAYAGPVETHNFADGSFDVVTLWGVLEHAQSPRDTIVEVSRITADGGLVVIYTQNADTPEARLLKKDWFIYELPRHLYSFTPATIARLLATGGYCVSETVLQTPLFYCQINWQYFKESRLKRKNDVVHNPTMVDRAVVKLLSLYRRLASGGRWSSAMTVYAVKRPALGDGGESDADA